MIPKRKRDSIIAAAVTFGVALIVLLLLFIMSVGYDREALATSSMPEIQDEEEIFLEPELLKLGKPDANEDIDIDEAAPQPPGEPEPAEENNPLSVIHDDKPQTEEPKTNKEPLVATKNNSDLTSPVPKTSQEEAQRIKDIQGKFKGNNGAHDGKNTDVSGTGGVGIKPHGSAKGWKMTFCPTGKVPTEVKSTTVTVSITVGADGKVTVHGASGGTKAQQDICKGWAARSKWQVQTGMDAKAASGTITFTIKL